MVLQANVPHILNIPNIKLTRTNKGTLVVFTQMILQIATPKDQVNNDVFMENLNFNLNMMTKISNIPIREA